MKSLLSEVRAIDTQIEDLPWAVTGPGKMPDGAREKIIRYAEDAISIIEDTSRPAYISRTQTTLKLINKPDSIARAANDLSPLTCKLPCTIEIQRALIRQIVLIRRVTWEELASCFDNFDNCLDVPSTHALTIDVFSSRDGVDNPMMADNNKLIYHPFITLQALDAEYRRVDMRIGAQHLFEIDGVRQKTLDEFVGSMQRTAVIAYITAKLLAGGELNAEPDQSHPAYQNLFQLSFKVGGSDG